MIGVVGLGFVGVTTALGFSDLGFSTVGYDIVETKRKLLSSGNIPFYEPGLKDALQRNLNKTFFLVDSIQELIDRSDIIFICVGTPQKDDGSADISQIRSVIKDTMTSNLSQSRKLILIKSTVPPKTTVSMQEFAKELVKKNETKVIIGTNPEFLREGHAWEDFVNPDRIVVGMDPDSYFMDKIKEIYSKFNSSLIFTSPNTAEFLKYLSNTLLSTLVSFSNEMSIIANRLGDIDISTAFQLLHLDKRFYGSPALITSYLFPGCGYGGYCLPKDTAAIYALSKINGFEAPILKGNLQVNENIMKLLLDKFFKRKYDKTISIGILGLSFKPDSDDVRESPARRCIFELEDCGYHNINCYDPLAMDNFKTAFPEFKISYSDDPQILLKSSKVIFILTAWNEFRHLDFQDKDVFDFRYTGISTKTKIGSL